MRGDCIDPAVPGWAGLTAVKKCAWYWAHAKGQDRGRIRATARRADDDGAPLGPRRRAHAVARFCGATGLVAARVPVTNRAVSSC